MLKNFLKATVGFSSNWVNESLNLSYGSAEYLKEYYNISVDVNKDYSKRAIDARNPENNETKDYLNRRRFRVGPVIIRKWLEQEQILNKEISQDIIQAHYLYFNTLPDKERTWITQVYKELGINKIKSSAALKECLSRISDNIFSAGRYHVDNWYKFVGIGLLSDYEMGNNSIIDNTIKDWFLEGKTYPDNSELERDKFYLLFREGVSATIRKNMKFRRRTMSWKDNIRKKILNYGNTGASKYQIDTDLTKNKWNTVVNCDVEQLIDDIITMVETHSTIFVKRETKKARGIVNAEFLFYLISDLFVDGKLENNDDGDYAYMHSVAEAYARLEKMRDSMDGTHCFLPMDQSKFDHQVSILMIDIIVEELALHMENFCDEELKHEITYLKDKLKLLFNNHYVKFSDGTFVKALKGMPSGIRLTIDIDTIISAALTYMTEQISGIKLKDPIFQGDDISGYVNNSDEAEIFTRTHRDKSGVVSIHPSKSFVDVEHTEFLRKGVNTEEIFGYPARMIHSVLFSNPAKSLKKEGEEELLATFNDWIKLINRGMDYDKILNFCVIDVAQKINFKGNRQKILDYILTPVSRGGLGLEDINLKRRSFVTLQVIQEVDENGYKNTLKHGLKKKLLDKFGRFYNFGGVLSSLVDENKKYIYKFINSPNVEINKKERLLDALKWNRFNSELKDSLNELIEHPEGISYKSKTKLFTLDITARSEDYPDRILMNSIVNEVKADPYTKSSFFGDLESEKGIKVVCSFKVRRDRCTKRVLKRIIDGDFSAPKRVNYTDGFTSMVFKEVIFKLILSMSQRVSRFTNSMFEAILALVEKNIDFILISNTQFLRIAT